MAAGACGYGESGVAPPADELFLPASVLIDPSADWLYVVNSNSDLRYNAGTLVSVDLRKVEADRGRNWAACPRTRFVPDAKTPASFCCKDLFDPRVLNCNERGYIDATATVRIGSFGGAMALQTFRRGDQDVRRVFVAVRAEPSITFVDVVPNGPNVTARCWGDPATAAGGSGPECTNEWKVRSAGSGDEEVLLPEEPHSLALDPALGVLYVGHFGRPDTRTNYDIGGVSAVDVCAPDQGGVPQLAGVSRAVYPGNLFQGVTSLELLEPGNPRAEVVITGRSAAEIGTVTLRAGDAVQCPAGARRTGPRDLSLVGGRTTTSSAFYPNGVDLRAFILSPDRRRAYVLHARQGQRDPAAIVVLDWRPDQRGEALNVPTDVIEVCGGPTDMAWHDAGRGPRLFVTCFEGGQIYVVDPALAVVTGVVEVGRGPARLVFSPRDPTVAYVAGFADNVVSVVDFRPGSPTENRVVQRIGFPHAKSK